MYLVPVLFTFYIQGVLNLKKNNSGAERLSKHVPLMEKGHKMSTKASVQAVSYTSLGQRRMGKGMQVTLPINQPTTDILSVL